MFDPGPHHGSTRGGFRLAGDRVARILVVEDDFLLAEELRTPLTRRGHDVFGLARRGEAGPTLALEPPPDLLISDVRLRLSIAPMSDGRGQSGSLSVEPEARRKKKK